MKPLLTLAACGCRFDEDGNLASRCAEHRDKMKPPMQKAKRLAPVVKLPRYKRFVHALGRLWK